MSASTSDDLAKALEKLVGGAPGWSPLDARPAVGARPGGIGVGRPSTSPSSGSGRVALEEKDAAQREYFDPRFLTSSDGIFAFSERHIKSILLVDDSRIVFKEPPA